MAVGLGVVGVRRWWSQGWEHRGCGDLGVVGVVGSRGWWGSGVVGSTTRVKGWWGSRVVRV